MKKLILFLLLTVIGMNIFAQQITINRIEQMPNIPEPYLMRDWEKVAQNYDSLVFNINLSGEYLPLMGINEHAINYPEHKSAAMVSYVGQMLGTSAEGINLMPAIIGATLSGINKTNQFDHNWVLMSEDFFNHRVDENIYLNNPTTNSGHDWWYETMPNIFFYQLNALYPNTGDYNYQFTKVADRWLEAVVNMGGDACPWQIPYMNYRAWNFNQMKPLTTGVKEPEAAGAIAWILYNAYRKTKNHDYLIGAEWAMEFLNNYNENPSYELQLAYGAYTAACMNAEIGTNYDIEKILNWCFNRGNLRGWGTIVGHWGEYDCSGLVGEANDAGNDYAFIMNGFQQAAALLPLVRYNEHYANAISKWILNMANASRLFYTDFLPADHQDSEEWSIQYDTNNCIAHEALKETYIGKSPFSTGDAIKNGWSQTNLALYGSSHVGYLGGIIDTTNVKAILKLNLTKTDFYAENYPSYLLWNPYENDTTVSINIGEQELDIYNSLNNSFIIEDASGIVNITIPATNSVLLVYVPVGAQIKTIGNKTFANDTVIDFDNGISITDYPPRIKALKALHNPVTINDSVFVYCTVENINNETIHYQWKIDDTILIANKILTFKAPEIAGDYNVKCKVISDVSGLSDSMNVIINVKEYIPYIPQIESLKASPGKIDTNQTTNLFCNMKEQKAEELSYTWTDAYGTLIGTDENVQWTSPDNFGNYKIYCTVSNVYGEDIDSIIVMVRDLSGLFKGEPILHLPLNGNVNDVSKYNNTTTAFNIIYETDAFGNTQQAADFNGFSSYIKVANNSLLNFKTGLTLTGWIYYLYNNENEAYPISHGNWENRWKVSVNNNTLRFTINTSAGIYDLDSKTNLEQGTWYYFSMIFTGTDMELYLDGQLDSFIPATGDINSTSYDLVIGKARPDQNFYFKGRLDDLYLFDHPLSPTDIKDMFENGNNIIEKKYKKNLVKIFPNPNRGDFMIYIENKFGDRCDYQLFNNIGRKIVGGIWLAKSNNKYRLNINGLETGIYFLQIRSKKYSIGKKIIIIK